MAIYHFSSTIISRSQGRSCVAAAAYRSAKKLFDERSRKTYDFTNKHDVIESEIFLPDCAPSWMKDREKLWNAVEQSERRCDAQLARDITISLPRELTHAQNWELAKAFVAEQFVSQGMVADVNFHSGHKGGEEQPHVHIMLTMRVVTPEGFGKKNRDWNKKALLETWREAWTHTCNEALAKYGHDVQIDHRTLAAQGIPLEPQYRIGVEKIEMKIKQERLDEHQARARRNGERLLATPELVLQAITRQQSTFTHQDLARYINRYTADAEQFNAVYHAVKHCDELVYLGQDAQNSDRFSTKSLKKTDHKMQQKAVRLSRMSQHRVASRHVRSVIKQHPSLSGEQRSALQYMTHGADLTCIVGVAGSGKSYLLNAARQAWENAGYQVQGMALSGVASDNLAMSAGMQSFTVANRQICWATKLAQLSSRDVVVVDEAGMLGSQQMLDILKEVKRAGAKAVLVGDAEQLQPIAAGAAFRALVDQIGCVELQEVRRQQIEWQQQATRDLSSSCTHQALVAYKQHGHLHAFSTHDEALTQMVERWAEAHSCCPDQSHIMLAYKRDDVLTLNQRARERLKAQGLLGQDKVCLTARGQRDFSVGERLYFLKGDRILGVRNGTLGTVKAIRGNRLAIQIDGKPSLVRVNLKQYNAVDYAYATTVYKAQSLTVDYCHVLLSRHFDRHATYVALSRHRLGVGLYYSHADFSHFKALSQVLSREQAKDVTLDYSIDTARQQCLALGMSDKEIATYLQQGVDHLRQVQEAIRFMRPLADQYKATNDKQVKKRLAQLLDQLATRYVNDSVVMRQLSTYDKELYRYVSARGDKMAQAPKQRKSSRVRL